MIEPVDFPVVQKSSRRPPQRKPQPLALGKQDEWPVSKASSISSKSSTPSTDSFDKEQYQMRVGRVDVEKNPVSLEHPPEQKFSRSKPFNSAWQEVGFVTSTCLMQFLGEYLITGFSLALPNVVTHLPTTSMSSMWPATIMSLVTSATILPLARLSDMYGGLVVYLSGGLWLAIWLLVAGFARSLPMLDVCRAMHGLAVAAFLPASYTLLGDAYVPGRRKNVVFALNNAAAGIGFFGGIFVSGLAVQFLTWSWYFWFAAMMALLAVIMTLVSVPLKGAIHRNSSLHMDWTGTFTIVAGLTLVVYALTAASDPQYGWGDFIVSFPLATGLILLALSAKIEWCLAPCSILPKKFFQAKGVWQFCFGALCFYGPFGILMFYSTDFMQKILSAPTLHIVLYFLPMAIGGPLVSAITGYSLSRISGTAILLVSALGWIGASLLFTVADPFATQCYAMYLFPALLLINVGMDSTYTLSTIFLTNSVSEELQGLAGAMCTVLLNLGISFGLAFADLVGSAGAHAVDAGLLGPKIQAQGGELWGYRTVFLFAAGSAVLGMVWCAALVRIPKSDGR